MKGRIIVCSFSSGIDDMPRKQQSDTACVLRVLDKCKRFSVFEATANPFIANTMTRIMRSGLVKDVGGGYPWTNVELTDAGRAFIAERGLAQSDTGDV